MKKRNLFTVLFLTAAVFLLSAQNGNGGKNKVGGYLGWPSGFSFSHEFNELVEIDLLVGWNGFGALTGGLTVQVAALFTVFEPTLDSQICPLSIGPAIGFTSDIVWAVGRTTFDIYLPLRWEVNLKDLPDFNLFIEYGPGVGFYLNNSPGTVARFASRGGVGLRYRIPN